MRTISAAMMVAAVVLAYSSTASAQTTRAYILIEMKAGSETQDAISVFGRLGNCKGIAQSLMPNEVIAAIECNDLASLNQSLTTELGRLKGVSRITPIVLYPGLH